MRELASGGLLLASIAILACGPVGPLPGGSLNGEPSSSPAGDWSFSDSHNTIQLEVRRRDPYSVNVWCVAIGGNLYVAAGRGESSVWARALLDDGAARVRIGPVLFELNAVRVTSVAEIDAYLDALSKKYEASDAQLTDFQADASKPPSAVLFRLDPSSPTGAAQPDNEAEQP
jgi:hypothetical protein